MTGMEEDDDTGDTAMDGSAQIVHNNNQLVEEEIMNGENVESPELFDQILANIQLSQDLQDEEQDQALESDKIEFNKQDQMVEQLEKGHLRSCPPSVAAVSGPARTTWPGPCRR